MQHFTKMPRKSSLTELRHDVQSFSIPAGCELLAFGSTIHGKEPGDLDVLVVYKHESQLRARELRENLEEHARFGLLHVTLLSLAEEQSVSFVERVGAIHIGGDQLTVDLSTTE